MSVENGETSQGWTARTWLLLAVMFWVLRAVAVTFGADGVGAAFLLLAFACLGGLVWRLLRGR